jgi:hypothetical protein
MMEEIAKYGTPTTKRIYAGGQNKCCGWKIHFIRARILLFSNTATVGKTLLIQR